MFVPWNVFDTLCVVLSHWTVRPAGGVETEKNIISYNYFIMIINDAKSFVGRWRFANSGVKRFFGYVLDTFCNNARRSRRVFSTLQNVGNVQITEMNTHRVRLMECFQLVKNWWQTICNTYRRVTTRELLTGIGCNYGVELWILRASVNVYFACNWFFYHSKWLIIFLLLLFFINFISISCMSVIY